MQRGSAVLVEGELQSRSWKTEEGFTRNTIEIKARRIQFLSRRDVHADHDMHHEHDDSLYGHVVDDNHRAHAAELEPEEAKVGADYGLDYNGMDKI